MVSTFCCLLRTTGKKPHGLCSVYSASSAPFPDRYTSGTPLRTAGPKLLEAFTAFIQKKYYTPSGTPFPKHVYLQGQR